MASAQPPYDSDNWGQPAPPATQPSAAVAVWITAGVQILLFGLCTSLFVVLSLLSSAQLEQILQDQPQEINPDTLQLFARVMAVIVLLVMFLPSVVLGILGFKVRQGSNPARLSALTILLIQVVITGGLLLINTASALITGQWLELIISVVLLGSLLTLELWTIAKLVQNRSGSSSPSPGPSDEPWNSHIPRGL